jgi:ATP-dependent Clp protease ATP-binding subunit ClpA
MKALALGPEHLLLGLLHESDSLAAEILTAQGLSLEAVREEVRLSSFRGEAARVDVAVSDQRWVATFFAGGHVAIEVFSASGVVEDETALSRLLDRLAPPQDSSRSPDPPSSETE